MFENAFKIGAGKVSAPGRKRQSRTMSLDPKFIHHLKLQLSELELEHDLKINVSDLTMIAIAQFFDGLGRDEQLQVIRRYLAE